MELNDNELENVLGGANPAVIQEQLKENKTLADGELSEDELEGVYAGPNREAMVDKALENPGVFRERSLEDIQREKEALIQQREEILKNHAELNQGGKSM